MGEALPNYRPENDNNGDVVTLDISSSLRKTASSVAALRPERFTQSHHNDDKNEADVGTLEGIEEVKNYVEETFAQAREILNDCGGNWPSSADQELYEAICAQYSDIRESIRQQKDFALGNETVDYGTQIVEGVGRLNQMIDILYDSIEEAIEGGWDGGVAVEEQAALIRAGKAGGGQSPKVPAEIKKQEKVSTQPPKDKTGGGEPPIGPTAEAIRLPDLSYETLTQLREESSAFIESLATKLTPELLASPAVAELHRELQSRYAFNRSYLEIALEGGGMSEEVRQAVNKNIELMRRGSSKIEYLIDEAAGDLPYQAKLKRLEITARNLFNKGLGLQEKDYSGHLPYQNALLSETLDVAREEVLSHIDDLRKKQKRGKDIDTSEIKAIEVELQRMKAAVNLMPSVRGLHEKEDYERPKELTEGQAEVLRQVFEKSEAILKEVTADLTQETFVLISGSYEELQILVQSVQDLAHNVLGRGNILAKEKQAFDNDVERILELKKQIEEETAKKTGWWDKDFQTSQGQEVRSMDGTLNQRWGDEQGDIGFQPEPIVPGEEEGKTGWWKDEYRDEQGLVPSVPEGPLTQRGDISVPDALDSLKTDRLVSHPVPGRKGQVQWSLRGPEASNEKYGQEEIEHYDYKYRQVQVAFQAISAKRNLENLSETDKLDFEFFEKTYNRFIDLIDEAEEEVEQVGEIHINIKKELDACYVQLVKGVEYYENLIANGDHMFNVQPANLDADSPGPVPVDDEMLPTPLNPDYEQARQGWMEAKIIHEEKHAQYLSAIDSFYSDWAREVEGKGFIDRNWTKISAKFGFKPELPDEIAKLRHEAFSASEDYNMHARKMIEKRTSVGKKSRGEVSAEVLNRYNRRFAHEILLNTFSSQLDSQTKAVESLGFKPNKYTSWLSKNKNSIKTLGALAVGVTVGSLLPAVWLARSIVGGAAGVGAAKLVNDKMTTGIESWKEKEYENKVVALAQKINDKSLSSSELENHYNELQKLLTQVDEKTRNKLIASIAAAGLVSVIAGGAAGEVGGRLFGWGATPEVASSEGVDRVDPAETLSQSESGDLDNRLDDAEKLAAEAQKMAEQTSAQDTSTAGAGVPPEAAPIIPPEAAPATPYTAEKGDNLWDIMEGQTNAKELAAMENLSEADKQRLIAEVVERINSDDALRAQVGFGETADNLREGGKVDLVKLNEVAEAVAKENNISLESPAAPPAPEAGVAKPGAAVASETAQTAEASLPAAAAEAGAAQNAAESLIGTKVSPDQITRFALDYPKGLYPTGFQNFEHDFQTQWVDKIQGPTPASGGLFGFLFGSTPNSADAFKLFSSYSVGEFNELAKVDEEALGSELAKNNIDMKDYTAWKDVMAQWQKEGLIIDPTDRFSYVAEAAFIKSLLPTPKP